MKIKTFDAYEIHPCVNVGNDSFETVGISEPIQADIWSLYGHTTGEGLLCVGDFSSYEGANEVFQKITGEDYGLAKADCSHEIALSYSFTKGD